MLQIVQTLYELYEKTKPGLQMDPNLFDKVIKVHFQTQEVIIKKHCRGGVKFRMKQQDRVCQWGNPSTLYKPHGDVFQ